ncbi:MAG: hypothetical protein JWQ19_2119 [Subtercola sp.]|nr:hypothetical protein [Subtercola sp.]
MTEDCSALTLMVQEAVELAHALVTSVAGKRGIRVLFIKGPVANIQGLRLPRNSADVDVLVDPDRVGELVDAFADIGWVARLTWEGGHLMPVHAVSIINPQWPCDIDLHDRYPGFFADQRVVFEEFWSHRDTVSIATQPAQCVDAIGNALVIAAHALRQPKRERNQAELLYLAKVLLESHDSIERQELLDRARRLRATETLRPFLDQLGLPATPRDLTSHERMLWTMLVSDETRTLGWVVELVGSPIRKLPARAFRALIPTEEQIRAIHPETGRGAFAVSKARLKRLRHGARSLPPAFLGYLQNRRTVR